MIPDPELFKAVVAVVHQQKRMPGKADEYWGMLWPHFVKIVETYDESRGTLFHWAAFKLSMTLIDEFRTATHYRAKLKQEEQDRFDVVDPTEDPSIYRECVEALLELADTFDKIRRRGRFTYRELMQDRLNGVRVEEMAAKYGVSNSICWARLREMEEVFHAIYRN